MAVEGGSGQDRDVSQQLVDTVRSLVNLREEVPEAKGPVTRTLNVLTDAFGSTKEKSTAETDKKPKT